MKKISSGTALKLIAITLMALTYTYYHKPDATKNQVVSAVLEAWSMKNPSDTIIYVVDTPDLQNVALPEHIYDRPVMRITFDDLTSMGVTKAAIYAVAFSQIERDSQGTWHISIKTHLDSPYHVGWNWFVDCEVSQSGVVGKFTITELL